MLIAFGFSRSAEAAAARARAAAGIGGGHVRSLIASSVSERLDGMFMAFCQAAGDFGRDAIDLTRLAIEPPAKLLRFFLTHPHDLPLYPWVAQRYPQMFSLYRAVNGLNPTVH